MQHLIRIIIIRHGTHYQFLAIERIYDPKILMLFLKEKETKTQAKKLRSTLKYRSIISSLHVCLLITI